MGPRWGAMFAAFRRPRKKQLHISWTDILIIGVAGATVGRLDELLRQTSRAHFRGWSVQGARPPIERVAEPFEAQIQRQRSEEGGIATIGHPETNVVEAIGEPFRSPSEALPKPLQALASLCKRDMEQAYCR